MNKRKLLGFFQIVMINVIAVDSIRTLPISAEYGFSLLFFYAVAAIMFFIPSALISAELGTGWPNAGGIYVWVREAFGKKISLIVIWLNWLYNLAWYPTIMALIAGTSAYFFSPDLADNRFYLISIILGLFWLATGLNCLGMHVSSMISTIAALLGTILPMVGIIILGIIWYKGGHPLATPMSWDHFFPNREGAENIAFLSNVLFGLLGLEMVATHAQEMKNPKKDYPKALFVSVIIILSTIVLSSLAIAMVVPKAELSLVTGTLQAFSTFFTAFNMPFMTPIVAALIILGGLGGVSAWIIGPTKGIMVASEDGSLPRFLTKKNQQGVPVNVLLLQAIIVTVLMLVFVFMPTINSSFWVLSAITAELALVVYIMLFATGLVLHYKKPHIKRTFKIPGGNFGIWITCILGSTISLFAIIVGFIPPKNLVGNHLLLYELVLIFGMVLLSILPLALTIRRKKKTR